jgi:hypothetical protein
MELDDTVAPDSRQWLALKSTSGVVWLSEPTAKVIACYAKTHSAQVARFGKSVIPALECCATCLQIFRRSVVARQHKMHNGARISGECIFTVPRVKLAIA